MDKQHYRIKTIEELVETYKKLDNDKSREVFLSDLVTFIKLYKDYSENPDCQFLPMLKVFHWIDDNVKGPSGINILKKEIDPKIEVGEGETIATLTLF